MYHFADLRLMHSIETLSNPGGLLALSAAPDHTVLACPGLHAGQVRERIRPTEPIYQASVPSGELIKVKKRLVTSKQQGTSKVFFRSTAIPCRHNGPTPIVAFHRVIIHLSWWIP